jgi:hypothetical protein
LRHHLTSPRALPPGSFIEEDPTEGDDDNNNGSSDTGSGGSSQAGTLSTTSMQSGRLGGRASLNKSLTGELMALPDNPFRGVHHLRSKSTARLVLAHLIIICI